ncbi:MAG: FGGY family carbohydrate kinase [Bacteroidota bacterium]
MNVTAVFDIGKTNKKCFLFDENYQEVYKSYQQFKEIKDEDGFPCDDIHAIKNWIQDTLHEVMQHTHFQVKAVNFSAYGASFVHLDQEGNPISPLYNYLKPFPEALLASFYKKYGAPLKLATETASPPLGMLNSGLQLYWLKYAKPEIFRKVRWSLHLPQYLSYLLTGVPLSDYTSIGCHTMLWDYEKGDYHTWVYAENLDQTLAPIVPTDLTIRRRINGQPMNIGIGIHDSSAALLPYKMLNEHAFLTLSTGTWSITLNPFNQDVLRAEELEQDCLNFLSIDGTTVKAARLFLGNEYKIWMERLAHFFNQELHLHQTIKVDTELLRQVQSFPKRLFKWESINSKNNAIQATDLSQFDSYEMAYHKLMQELVDLQIEVLHLAQGSSETKQVFIDGGFINNKLFVYLLAQGLPDHELLRINKPLGSALGAAIVLEEPHIAARRLSESIQLQH